MGTHWYQFLKRQRGRLPLLHKAQTDIIGKAKNRWKDVEVRVGRLKASLAAKKGVKGRSTFDYDSPGATNMIRRGEFNAERRRKGRPPAALRRTRPRSPRHWRT